MNELETIRSRIHEIRGQRVMLDFDLAQMYGVETRVLNQAVKRNIERFPEDFMFQLTKGEWEILRSQIVTANDLKFQNGISNSAENQTDNALRSQIVTIKSGDNQEDEVLISQIATSNSADNQEDEVLISQIVTSKPVEKRGGTQKLPYAFTEQGVAMLSSVLRSPLAIQVNIGIMRAFVEMRRRVSAVSDTQSDVAQLRKDFEELKLDIEDMLRDQNDINESTRAQLDAISTALVELQSKGTSDKPRRRIGFVQD